LKFLNKEFNKTPAERPHVRAFLFLNLWKEKIYPKGYIFLQGLTKMFFISLFTKSKKTNV